MIDEAVKHSLKKPMNKFKSVASQVNLMAMSEGIELDQVHACSIEGGIIECDWAFASQNKQ